MWRPSSSVHLASFLGMTAYNLRFLPWYCAIRAPLRLLLKKEDPRIWTTACTEAITQLKTQLIEPPGLAHFDPSSPTLLTCDASQPGVCCLNSKTARSSRSPLPHGSLIQLTRSRWERWEGEVGEREALACVWACKCWHIFLYGRFITLQTDHQTLKALLAKSG